MTLTIEQRRALLATRDLPVDLMRVCCVLLVVVLHSLMVGLAVAMGAAVLLARGRTGSADPSLSDPTASRGRARAGSDR